MEKFFWIVICLYRILSNDLIGGSFLQDQGSAPDEDEKGKRREESDKMDAMMRAE